MPALFAHRTSKGWSPATDSDGAERQALDRCGGGDDNTKVGVEAKAAKDLCQPRAPIGRNCKNIPNSDILKQYIIYIIINISPIASQNRNFSITPRYPLFYKILVRDESDPLVATGASGSPTQDDDRVAVLYRHEKPL